MNGVLFVMQYLLGAGGSVSGGGGRAAGGCDELRPMLLSMGPLLEMDSDMQHDDDAQAQRLDWLRLNQSKAGRLHTSDSVTFG